MWSASVDDLLDWRHDGISFQIDDLNGMSYTDQEGNDQILQIQDEHVLYAPDVIYNPNTQLYTLFGFIAVGDPASLMFTATSEDPAGPFSSPQYLGWGFDPAALADDVQNDNGQYRIYLYYSEEADRAAYACELDPVTLQILPETVHTPRQNGSVEGNQTMFSHDDEPFYFFEGSSIRKIEDTYVLSYARSVEQNLAEIGYAISDNPYGDPALGTTWEYGGVIIANNGEQIESPYEEGKTINTFTGGNNHGGMAEINGQWYQFYHRSTNIKAKRQAMVTPINLFFEEDGKLVIEQAEFTSEGFETEGLDPFAEHYASITTYAFGEKASKRPGEVSNEDMNFDPDADHGDWFPVTKITTVATIGYKYFNFGEGADGLSLNLSLKEMSPAAITVYASDARESYQDAEPARREIGAASLEGTDGEIHTITIPVESLAGKKAIYLEIVPEGDVTDEICQINKIWFEKSE